MRKKLLMGVFGLILLLPFVVKAETFDPTDEGKSISSATVTVGEVETPVYSVEIKWEALQFDWVYDETDKDFTWRPAKNENDDYVNNFWINDYSTNGEIVPSVRWTSTEDYEYVLGKFEYEEVNIGSCVSFTEEVFMNHFNGTALEGIGNLWTDSSCTNVLSEQLDSYRDGLYYISLPSYIWKSFDTEIVPENARHTSPVEDCDSYNLRLFLEKQSKPTSAPETGDTIGTVTITIRAA